jgi:hypothetical protein
MSKDNLTEVPAAKREQVFLRNIAIIAGIVTAVVVLVILIPELSRDKWEYDNLSLIRTRLDDADKARDVDVVKAYNIYEEVLSSALKHDISSSSLRSQLDEARTKKDKLYPFVQEQLRLRKELRQSTSDKVERRIEGEETIAKGRGESVAEVAKEIEDKIVTRYAQQKGESKDEALRQLESTPEARRVAELDRRRAELKRRMDRLVERAQREGMSSESEAEWKSIKEEAENLKKGYLDGPW